MMPTAVCLPDNKKLFFYSHYNMRIIWLAHEASLSGANRCLLEYLSILKKQGVENYLVIPYGNGELDLKAREAGIAFEKIKFYSWAKELHAPPTRMRLKFKRWLRNYIAVKKLASCIKKISPDYVVTNTIATPVGAIAAKKTGAKHVWLVHEFGEEDHGFTIAGGFSKGAEIINNLSCKIVFNSLSVRRKYQSAVSDSKAFIVHNAVMVADVVPLPLVKEGPLRLMMLGQIAPAKNIMEALQALQICRKKGLEFSLKVVGTAEDKAYLLHLKTFVHKAGMDALINFYGAAAEPVSILQNHHALLMCSHHEAFGRVTVEALKCGLPVIAANTGGSPEIIEKDANGYFYEAGNAADLADKILLLNKNYLYFDRMKIAVSAKEKYNEANTAEELLKVFT